MPEPPTCTDPLFTKMKAVEARAIERLKQRGASKNRRLFPRRPPKPQRLNRPTPRFKLPRARASDVRHDRNPDSRARRTSA